MALYVLPVWQAVYGCARATAHVRPRLPELLTTVKSGKRALTTATARLWRNTHGDGDCGGSGAVDAARVVGWCGFHCRTLTLMAGLVSEGLVSEGLVSEGLVSKGLVSEGLVSRLWPMRIQGVDGDGDCRGGRICGAEKGRRHFSMMGGRSGGFSRQDGSGESVAACDQVRSGEVEGRVEGKELVGKKLQRRKEQEDETGDVAYRHSLHREALLVIDMQRDFCLPSAPLFVAGAPAILPAVREAVVMARKRGIVVVWVMRVHDPSGVDVERSRMGLFRPGGNGGVCVEGSKGVRLVDGLVSEGDDVVVVKKRWSGFLFMQLDLVLRRLGITDLVLAGIQTPNCVRATAFDAVALDYRTVSVLRDATAAASPDMHEANLFDMRNVGIATPSVAEWASSWDGKCVPSGVVG